MGDDYMSFISAILSEKFITIACDGQLTRPDGTIQNGFHKYFKLKNTLTDTIYIGGTGSADALIQLKKYMTQQSVKMDWKTAREYLVLFLNSNHDFFKENHDSTYLMVGTDRLNKRTRGIAFEVGKSITESKYFGGSEHLSYIFATPPDVNYEDVKKTFLELADGVGVADANKLIQAQREIFKYVASKSATVNTEFIQKRINTNV